MGRITRNRIPWPRLIAEVGAIVVSILLAFSVDAGWSRYQEALQESAMESRLAEELEKNLSQVQSSVLALESLYAHAEDMAALLDDSHSADLVAVPDRLIGSFFFNPEWSSLETTTADGLEASGRIELLRDPDVSEGVALWAARRASVGMRQQEARTHFYERMLPHLSNEIDIAPFVAIRDPYRESEGDRRAFPWEGAAGTTELRNSAQLRNLVSERVLFVTGLRIQVDMAADALAAVLETVAR
jgi:hypothetical protein